MALVLALGLTYWLIPYFGTIIERPLALNLISNPLLLPVLTALILFVGIFSGSYPAIFMSSLKPINTLKGKATSHSPKLSLQSILVVIQYAVSIVLIISSLVIYLQFDFIQNKELGYDKDHIIVVNTRSPELRKNIEPVKTALLEQSNILTLSTSNSLPSSIGSSSTVRLNKEDTADSEITMYNNGVDKDYLKTFGIVLESGRDFSSEVDFEKDIVIINETAVKSLGWTSEEAIGNHFYQGKREITVIGVVKDFHMFSLHLDIKPLMLLYGKSRFNYASIKVNPENIQNTIASIEDIVQKHSSYPFEFQFMDAEFDKLYKADIRLGKIFGIFTLLAIMIASLGLFGLAAYTTKQRTKEIGIRKVLGASVQTIMGLIARDFLKMVLVGLAIAIPIAWFMMNIWLQEYAYRIELEWWIFAIAAVLACVISLLTISSQTIKASITNPVDSLRSE
jgi:putative ABC transport system permease protein